MTMFRFGPLLALAGAACLVAWTPEGRSASPEGAALDPASGSRVDAAPTETGSLARAARSASCRAADIGDGFASFAGAEPRRPRAAPEAGAQRRELGREPGGAIR